MRPNPTHPCGAILLNQPAPLFCCRGTTETNTLAWCCGLSNAPLWCLVTAKRTLLGFTRTKRTIGAEPDPNAPHGADNNHQTQPYVAFATETNTPRCDSTKCALWLRDSHPNTPPPAIIQPTHPFCVYTKTKRVLGASQQPNVPLSWWFKTTRTLGRWRLLSGGGGVAVDGDDDEVMMMVVVETRLRQPEGERPVETHVLGDQVDPVTRKLFGFGRKSPSEKFSGGGVVAVAGIRWLGRAAGIFERERSGVCVYC
ncbi:hypothetical protein Tco_0380922 [Tanacetum coccineum]